MKINLNEFNGSLAAMADGDSVVRSKGVAALAKYTGNEWEGTPDIVPQAVEALTGFLGSEKRNGAARAEAVKALGNIGVRSPNVVPLLLKLLQKDTDSVVRMEAIRAMGKLGEGAKPASKTLVGVLEADSEDRLRAEAAWALARVDPATKGTATALAEALTDKSSHVAVCAAEALWKVSQDPGKVVPTLATRLKDAKVRSAAAQALCRIGPPAKGAVPALLSAAKENDRLFRESVAMALRRIDPSAAAKAGF